MLCLSRQPEQQTLITLLFRLQWLKNEESTMRLLLALLLPWLQFFTIGRPFAGIICLLLQISLIGWIPAAIWSVYALSQYNTDQKIKQAMSPNGE
jgi:uncharacterized membrane protein YqaE (UPF0057 family)